MSKREDVMKSIISADDILDVEHAIIVNTYPLLIITPLTNHQL